MVIVRFDLGFLSIGPKKRGSFERMEAEQSPSLALSFWSSSSAITSFFLSLQSLNGLQWSDLAFEHSRERACLLVFFLSSSVNLILSLFTSEPLTASVSISPLSHLHSHVEF